MPMIRKRVFILTPSSGFGEQIRQVLEDTGSYQPFLFSKPKDAVEAARKDAVALIVLDAELGAQAPAELIAELRLHAPHSRLLIISKQKDPHDPELMLLAADGILPSPFYLPDLVAAIEQFFGPIVPKDSPKRTSYGDNAAQVPVAIRGKTSPPLWLEDVSQAAAYLARLSIESASRAALITKGANVWAYAGELPAEAADELAAVLAEHANEADLARFIHLNATGVDYMLYATGLGGDFTLALTFDAQMSFSQMRARVNDLAKAIAIAPQPVTSEKKSIGRPAERQADVYLQAGEREPPAPLERSRPQAETPTPMPSTSQPIARPEAPAAGAPSLKYLAKAIAVAPQPVTSEKKSIGRPAERQADVYLQAGEREPPAPLERSRPQAETPTPMPSTSQPIARPEAPAAGAPSLKYSFVLIPRLPKHRLKGDLVERLAAWLPELCLAFAWNLEHVSVEAEYLQWTISIGPDSAPESVVEVLDKHLSAYIFEDFPRMGRDNPSGHFWAPGCLIVNGEQPSPEQISEYIKQTRARQGVSRQ